MKWCKVIIYVLFYMLSAKIVNSQCFYLILIFIKSKMATMFGDGTYLQ